MQRPASSTSSLLTMGGGTNNSSSLRAANNNSPARVATAPSGPGQSGNKSGRNVDFNLSFQQNKKPHNSTKQGNNQHSRPSGMSSLKNSSANMGLGGASLSLNNTMTDLHDNLSFFTDDENRTLDGSVATLEQNHTMNNQSASSSNFFQKARLEGVNLYAKTPELTSTNLASKRATTPSVEIAWNSSMTKIHYKPRPLSRNTARAATKWKRSASVDPLTERPPWTFRFKNVSAKDTPVPDAFADRQRKAGVGKEFYVPWYLRNRAGKRHVVNQTNVPTRGLIHNRTSQEILGSTVMWRI
ncbi:unnamed protein product [Amoebophrya sp. A120]|nr:unnamed protein product [Amoebophrya sp. A120]|eukprot:GSA120T00014475001.1